MQKNLVGDHINATLSMEDSENNIVKHVPKEGIQPHHHRPRNHDE
jgi:hypothetical protein